MHNQLITIGPDGTLHGLDLKKRGLDLKQFGKAKIERTSEILWNEEAQLWEIKFLHGTDAGQTAAFRHAFEFVNDPQAGIDHFGFPPGEPEEPLRFDDYERAVAAEVLLIQSAHLVGLGHRIAPSHNRTGPRSPEPLTFFLMHLVVRLELRKERPVPLVGDGPKQLPNATPRAQLGVIPITHPADVE